MPRVLDPSTIIVFCEGRPGSVDDLLLANLMPIGHVLVQPVGGKRGIAAFIEGYLGTYEDARPTFVAYRDRDFDAEPPNEPQLLRLQGEKPIFLSYRAAVENYLVDAGLVHRYWVERETAPAWGHGPALPISQIDELVLRSAQELAEYQAVRWGLASLKPGPRWPELETTWTDRSGVIPASLGYSACLAEARELVASYADATGTVRAEALTRNADQYRMQFTDKSFVAEGRYLVWFHGKDLLTVLCGHLSASFPRRHYAAWAAEHVDAEQHPDLVELRTHVESIKDTAAQAQRSRR